MKTRKLNKIIRRLALGLAVAAIAAPAAQADPWYDDSGIAGNATVRPDDRAVRVSPLGAPETAVRPDDRPGLRGPGAVIDAVSLRPDDRAIRVTPVSAPETAVRPDDRPGLRGPGAAPQDSPLQIVIRPGGFDWTDAGIGAVFALGLVLLAGGAALVARRHRQTSAAAF